MTIAIDATVGGSAANSFVTELEQIAYMATRLNSSAWTTVSGSSCTESEKAAMIEATREISALAWQGAFATSTQALSWPRWFVLNPDLPWQGTVYYASDVIPQRVKDATMELAFQFLNAGTTDLASLNAAREVIESTVDVITTRYSAPSQRPQELRRFPRVWNRIKCLLAQGAGVNIPILRG